MRTPPSPRDGKDRNSRWECDVPISRSRSVRSHGVHVRGTRHPGFTIIETLAVLAVIAVVAGIVVANIRSGQRKAALDNEALRVAQFIREAKTRTLGQVVFRGEVPRGGYGIRVNVRPPQGSNRLLVLFADRNENQRMDGEGPSCESECVVRDLLRSGIVIKQLLADNAGIVPVTMATILFPFQESGAPLFADPLSFSETPVAEVRLVLSSASDLSLERTVVVKPSGEVNVEE